MALAFLLDENMPGAVGDAILRHNRASDLPLDVVRIGEPDVLPYNSSDLKILAWAEQENRILVTEDKNTMPQHLREHLEAGHHSPDVFIVRKGCRVREIVEYLALAANASESLE